MRWFGKSWGAEICEPADHTDTPIGEFCMRCEKQIEADDQGLLMPYIPACGNVLGEPWHLGCFLRSIRTSGNTSLAS